MNSHKIRNFGWYYSEMKHNWILMFIFFLATSCQFFETEKISSETFIEEEIKSINWNDVDQYPVFSECEDFTDKLDQKKCFETTLSSQLYYYLHSEKIVVTHNLNDTLELEFEVSAKGELTITNIEIDSILETELPLLKDYIIKSIDTIQPVAPAYKRGIPVRTSFTLPIVIKTD